MASYSIVFKPTVEKDFRKLPRLRVSQAWGKIEELKINPYPLQSVKLTGTERLFRIRFGDYRIIYEVNSKNKQITIHYIRHRRNVYRTIK